MKRLLPVAALSILTLAGCANTAPYSGDVYRGNQAQTGQSVSYGTIVPVRPQKIAPTGSTHWKWKCVVMMGRMWSSCKAPIVSTKQANGFV